MSVGHRAEKFNIVSNNHGHTVIFLFETGNTLFEQVWSKNKNCHLKVRFGSNSNSNMQNSMVIFIFSGVYLEILFLDKFSPKFQNCQFKLKLGTKTNSNIQNSMELDVHFFCFRPEISFLGKFNPKN